MSIHQTFNYSRSNVIGQDFYELVNPSELFTGGARGFWYEANDSATLWQDSAQTIQIDSTSQNVNAWSDKSGNNFDLTGRNLVNDSAGLLYEVDGDGKSYINFDRGYISYAPGGTTRWTGVNASDGQEITVICAINSANDSATTGCFGSGPRAFTYIDLRMMARGSAALGPEVFYDNIGEVIRYNYGSSIKNTKTVFTAKWRYDDPYAITKFRLNGVNVLSTATLSGSGGAPPKENSPFFNQTSIDIGYGPGGASTSFEGAYYGAVGFVGYLDHGKMVGVEKYMAELMGIDAANWN